MKNILEVDIGNTRAKWRVIEDDASLRARGVIENGNWRELNSQLESVSHVRLASVANQNLSDYIHQHYPSLSCFEAQTTAECAGLINSYDQPEHMGVDRWLAMLAAYHQSEKKACLVIDCGSAITVDAVNADGYHEGGFIVPGLRILETSLFSNTDNIASRVQSDFKDLSIDWGVSTTQAVAHGRLSMVSLWLNQLIQQATFKQKDTLVFLTGGDAEMIQAFLPETVAHHPELVLDGLRLADA